MLAGMSIRSDIPLGGAWFIKNLGTSKLKQSIYTASFAKPDIHRALSWQLTIQIGFTNVSYQPRRENSTPVLVVTASAGAEWSRSFVFSQVGLGGGGNDILNRSCRPMGLTADLISTDPLGYSCSTHALSHSSILSFIHFFASLFTPLSPKGSIRELI